MIYAYTCDFCNNKQEIEQGLEEVVPKAITCEACGKQMRRDWKASITIPDHFKAVGDICNRDSGSNFDYIKHRMAKGSRPSGKEKIYY
jgi:predicted nucleic acid-binding Zn ribbon protein